MLRAGVQTGVCGGFGPVSPYFCSFSKALKQNILSRQTFFAAKTFASNGGQSIQIACLFFCGTTMFKQTLLNMISGFRY